MSRADRDKWDARYGDAEYHPRTNPSPFLEHWLPRLAPGRALELACGVGRNALRLAEAGYLVDALDISTAALAHGREAAEARGLRVNWIAADLDDAALEIGAYDVVIVFRFLSRTLVARIIEAMKPDGWLLFETHLRTPVAVGGPHNPEFRLRPQELLEAFAALRIVHYEELLTDDANGRRMALARLVACQGDPGF